jgi:hypothetical protein
LTLLARLTAHSSQSGHTPPTLSPLFGPLLFGLGAAALPFHLAYAHYLRAVYAAEHVLLAFVRWQDQSGDPATAGVPTRLKDWIRGYPHTLPHFGPNLHQSQGQRDRRPPPRRGARTVRVVSVRRNVRMYSPDLVKTAASWAHRPRGLGAGAEGANGLAGSKDWERIAPPALKLPPRYSDNYRKRMDMAPGFHPDTTSSSGMSAASSLSSSTASTITLAGDGDYFGLGDGKAKDGEFKSLTDMKWGEFETIGFGGLSDESKLQFDLTEGARAVSRFSHFDFFFYFRSVAAFMRGFLVHISILLRFLHLSFYSGVLSYPTVISNLIPLAGFSPGTTHEATDDVMGRLLVSRLFALGQAAQRYASVQHAGRDDDQ